MLELVGIRARVSSGVIIYDTDLSLPDGVAIGLRGANGSGKSTLLGVVSGHVEATAGRQLFRGTDISRWSSYRRARRGILRSYQDPRPFRSLTVAQTATAYGCSASRFQEQLGLVAPGIGQGDRMGALSVGQTKLVEIAALLSAPRSILMLDEPLAGLDAGARRRVVERLQARRKTDTLLIVEHDLRLLHDMCDEIVEIETRVEEA